jgi:phytoene desaturase
MKKVIIIGAGVAGLASAIRLKTLGFDVEIYEKNEKVGGRMFSIEERGFKFDVGPTIVMMPDFYKDVFTFSGVNPDHYIKMVQVDPLNVIHFSDGTSIKVSSNLPSLMEELEKFGMKETDGYLAYLADVYERYSIVKETFLDKSYRKPTEFFNPKTLYKILKLRTLNSAYNSISKFVKDEKLRQILSFQTLYIGVSPFSGPSIYTIIPMIELVYGVWYIQGGMYQMAKAMEKRFIEMGGKIRLNSPVEEILTLSGKVTGVLVNGKPIYSDIVLCNADFPWAMNNLIKDDSLKGKYTSKNIEKMKYASSSFVIYMGLKKKYPTSVHAIRFAKDFRKNIDDLEQDILPEDPSFYMYSPSQIDPTVAPENKELLYILVPVPNMKSGQFEWDFGMTEAYKDKIMDMIEKIPGFEDIKKNIEVLKIYSPKTYGYKFNLEYGSTFGLKPTLFQSVYFRPQNKFKTIENLYFAGSSNHPGAGVPIVLASAKLAVNDILKDHITHE